MSKSRLAFRILGPLEVRADGIPVRVGGPKQRALLALLLLSANRVVSRDRLLEELMPGQSGEAADHALRVRLSRLRKVLETPGSPARLVTRPPGYFLRVEPGELDLDLFEQSLAEGRRALETGDPKRAADLFREGLSLWRGRPLADLEFEPFARVEVERLEELRLTALEERIEAEMELGLHSALASELELLVAEHPLRERLRAQQMLALYRAGRQADALEAYRVGRSLLVDQLALEPSPQLRELEQAILRQDASLEPAAGMPSPVATETQVATGSLRPRLAADERDEVPPGRRTRRPALLVAGLALGTAAVASAIAIPLEATGSGHRQQPIAINALALVSPSTGRLIASVPTQAAPTEVVAGFGSLWVSAVDAGNVVRIDPSTRAVVETIPVGRGPTALAVGGGDVWVVDTLDDTLSRIDPGTDRVTQTIPVGPDPSAVLVSAGCVWVASRGDGTVRCIDPSTGKPEGAITTGNGPSALAASDGTLWVANNESGTVSRVDTRTRTVTDTRHVGDAPSAIAATSTGVWVLDRLDATIARLDPVRDVVTSTFPLAGAPSGLTLTKDALWVADERAGTLLRLDPKRGGITRRIRIGGRPQALETSGGLWTAIDAGGTRHRGGTLTEVATHIDTIDPADSQSNNSPPTQIPGLLNDGLVTLDHVAGSEGTRLVPDLAVSLPTPSDVPAAAGDPLLDGQVRPADGRSPLVRAAVRARLIRDGVL